MSILIPIANGTEEMEAVIVADMLRRASLSVMVAGDGHVVTCARRIRIVPDKQLNELNDSDHFTAVVIPGGSPGVENLLQNEHLQAILRRHKESGGLIAAICAAPLVLHEWNMLEKGMRVTSHPSVEYELRSAYDYSFERVVEDGNVVTSRGAGTAFEFALTLIRILVNDATAVRIAGDIVMYE